MIPAFLCGVSYARAEWSLGPHIRPHSIFPTPNTMLNHGTSIHSFNHPSTHICPSIHPSVCPIPASTSDQALEKCWWESSEWNRPCPSHLEGHVSREDRHIREDMEWWGSVGTRGNKENQASLQPGAPKSILIWALVVLPQHYWPLRCIAELHHII